MTMVNSGLKWLARYHHTICTTHVGSGDPVASHSRYGLHGTTLQLRWTSSGFGPFVICGAMSPAGRKPKNTFINRLLIR